MAVIPPNDGKTPGRRPSLRGVVMEDVAFGKERIRAWPRKRPNPSPKQRLAQEQFRAAQAAAKWMSPDVLLFFRETVEGTPLLPRDLVTSMLYNRLAAFQLDDGRLLFPMPAKIDVSQSLDAISQTPGTILVRGEQYWEPMNISQVLPTPIQGAVCNAFMVGSLSGSNVWYTVPFNDPVYDPNGWFDPSNNSFTPDQDGVYILDYRVRLNTSAMQTMRLVENGTPLRNLGHDEAANAEAIAGVTVVRRTGFERRWQLQFFKPGGTGTISMDLDPIQTYWRAWGPFTPWAPV